MIKSIKILTSTKILRFFISDAPLHVIILGSTQAKVGDTVQLNCTAGPSNPAASIRWQIDGRQVFTNNSQTVRDPENGWITSSTTSISITPDKTNIVIICQGMNKLLSENVIATHTINVLCEYLWHQILKVGL